MTLPVNVLGCLPSTVTVALAILTPAGRRNRSVSVRRLTQRLAEGSATRSAAVTCAGGVGAGVAVAAGEAVGRGTGDTVGCAV
ncbi:MAG TPA: hypothetical protein VI300_10195, partial [Solirubrobacter sp.]